MNRVKLLDRMNSRETEEITSLRRNYLEARERKDYKISDRLRSELEQRGMQAPDYMTFMYLAESSESRQLRAVGRYLYDERK